MERANTRQFSCETTHLGYTPDGRQIVSSAVDDITAWFEIKVWDASGVHEPLTLKGHTNSVKSVAYSRDGRRIFSGSDTGEVKVWDANTGEEILTLNGHTDSVTGVAFSPDGQRIVSQQ